MNDAKEGCKTKQVDIHLESIGKGLEQHFFWISGWTLVTSNFQQVHYSRAYIHECRQKSE